MNTEPVTITRTGASLSALVDPEARRLYLGSGVDVQAGDVVGFRGYTRRILLQPQLWLDAGIVAEFEDAPPLLPDWGSLLRGSGPPVLNEDTGVLEPGTDAPVVWSGPCAVEPLATVRPATDVGDQRVGVVRFIVSVPLTLVDVRPDDTFMFTQSRDGRVIERVLSVTGVQMSSSLQVREVFAFDNQGGG